MERTVALIKRVIEKYNNNGREATYICSDRDNNLGISLDSIAARLDTIAKVKHYDFKVKMVYDFKESIARLYLVQKMPKTVEFAEIAEPSNAIDNKVEESIAEFTKDSIFYKGDIEE